MEREQEREYLRRQYAEWQRQAELEREQERENWRRQQVEWQRQEAARRNGKCNNEIYIQCKISIFN